MTVGFKTAGEYSPDNLFAGSFPVITQKVTLSAGTDLARGTLLAQLTADKKYLLATPGGSDGSQTPKAVLAETISGDAADKEALVYLSGEFNASEMIFGGTFADDLPGTQKTLEDGPSLIYIKI